MEIYKIQNGLLNITSCRKPIDRRDFLHYDSAHPKSLIDGSIPFSQGSSIKRICSETEEIEHFKDLKDA